MARILIIEDDPLYREMIDESLTDAGFETILAGDGATGIERAKSYKPDLIISDVVMDKADGYKVLSTLRSDAGTAGIPFIMITGWSSKGGHRQGMALGADDYLSKPFNATELLASVNAQLQKYEHARAVGTETRQAILRGVGSILPTEIEKCLQYTSGMAEVIARGDPLITGEELREAGRRIGQDVLKVRKWIENTSLFLQLQMLESDDSFTSDLRSTVTEGVATFLRERSTSIATRLGRSTDLHLDLADGSARIGLEYLDKILSEVLENALLNSPAGSRVDIRSAFSKRRFGLSITDHGSGMTPSQLNTLGAFVQVGASSFEQEGLGLGLALAKKIAVLHGGVVHVKSAPDRGTQVFVEIPR